MRALGLRLHTIVLRVAPLLPSSLDAPLHAASRDIRRSLALAFRVAAAHGQTVTLAPSACAAPGHVSLHLPPEVAWGRPDAIPLPLPLKESRWSRGAPLPMVVMSGGRALPSVWFLHHGREALCLRLNMNGSLELLRYRPRLKAWTHC